jgi:hypothetical protein
MKRALLLISLIVLLSVSLACNFANQFLQQPAVDQPPSVAQPAQPIENLAQPPTHTPFPTIHPTVTAQPPTPVPVVNPFLPSGFLVSDSNGGSVTFYGTDGVAKGIIQSPGLSPGGFSGSNVHVASGVTDSLNAPLIYYSFENAPEIRQTLNGNMSTLVSMADLTYMRGAPGQSAFVYVTVTWGNDNLISHIFARNIQGGGASWAHERVDPQIYATIPLAVQAANNEPQGVWFSLMPYGIGGDIVFPPHKGLYYLDLMAGGTETLFLSDDFNPVGLSPDLNWVAYAPADNGFVNGTNPTLTLYNLLTLVGTEIPINPASDRGAGFAVFSPDNQYVAWMEGSGWMMAETPNFHSKVVIADINGTILAELPDNVLAGFSGDPNSTWVRPVGWLDAETLIVDVRGDDWADTSLVKVRFDGSNIAYLASGQFEGFTYP